MDDDFLRAINKFNSNLYYNKRIITNNLDKIKKKNEKKTGAHVNKLKEDLELQYIHNSNNKICQKFLTLIHHNKSSKLNKHSDKIILVSFTSKY
ncbi:hypothetical protein HEP_00034700 [Hepatocystis sp. ex Piliocolobus tephrosceles]|nr:hypothetical protein HEP_00034700 [Hepatocystis sp. ex Piliocolobus tephrosceles]